MCILYLMRILQFTKLFSKHYIICLVSCLCNIGLLIYSIVFFLMPLLYGTAQTQVDAHEQSPCECELTPFEQTG